MSAWEPITETELATFALPENQQDLFSDTDTANEHTALWLCLQLPQFALQVLQQTKKQRGLDADQAEVVVGDVESNGRCIVHSVSALAADAGIAPGMPLNAAFALCHSLTVHQRNLQLEQQELTRMGDWTQRFSSLVSLDNSDAVVLEINQSLRLFNGLAALLARVSTEFNRDWPYAVSFAVSPTPLASYWLASYQFTNQQTPVITDVAALRSVLGELPINAIGLKTAQVRKLQRIGVLCLRDVWRLPRAGLARRYGLDLLRYLDRALGTQNDVPHPHNSFEPIAHTLELPCVTHDYVLMDVAISRLLELLLQELRSRDIALNTLTVIFLHFRLPPTRMVLSLRLPSRDKAHISGLLKLQLERLQLPAPTHRISLVVEQWQVFTPETTNLFSGDFSGDADLNQWQQLLDQLQTRLGLNSISYLEVLQDHRPERAWRLQPINSPSSAPTEATVNAKRPLFLLAQPKLIFKLDSMQLLAGPERIVGGWWDGADIERDYYIAVDKGGRYLWIFQDRTHLSQWYHHGLFG